MRTTTPSRRPRYWSAAGATLTARPGHIDGSGLGRSGIVRCSTRAGAFSEVSAHRATLEEAYMELTATRRVPGRGTGAVDDQPTLAPNRTEAQRAQGSATCYARVTNSGRSRAGIAMLFAGSVDRRFRPAAQRSRFLRPARSDSVCTLPLGPRGRMADSFFFAHQRWPATAASPSG